MRWLDSITYTMDMGLCGLWQLVMDREAWSAVVHGGCIESDMTEQLRYTSFKNISLLWPIMKDHNERNLAITLS